MEQSRWLINVEQSSFAQDVLERSHELPVLVDFWAPWCGPCRTLGPILEKLLEEKPGRFLLAKIDSDQNQEIASQYSIRGIPAVKLFVDGEVVDEFTGALPERAVRQFLDRAIPSPLDRLAQQAKLLMEQEEWQKAEIIYTDILKQESNHTASLLGMIEILLQTENNPDAQQRFEQLPFQTKESPEGKILRARLLFSGQADDLQPLHNQVTKNPHDLEARLALGHGLVKQEQYAEGMEQFLEMIRQDRAFQEDAGRKAILQVFDLLGPTHPLVTNYRPKLSALLFS